MSHLPHKQPTPAQVKAYQKRVEVGAAHVLFCAIAYADAAQAAMQSLEPPDAAAANSASVRLCESVKDYRLAVARRALL